MSLCFCIFFFFSFSVPVILQVQVRIPSESSVKYHCPVFCMCVLTDSSWQVTHCTFGPFQHQYAECIDLLPVTMKVKHKDDMPPDISQFRHSFANSSSSNSKYHNRVILRELPEPSNCLQAIQLFRSPSKSKQQVQTCMPGKTVSLHLQWHCRLKCC